MEVSRIRALRGPNLWTRFTAIEAIVRCERCSTQSERFRHLLSSLHQRFPAMAALPEPSDDSQRSLAWALEQATLALQIAAGSNVSFSRTIAAPEPGVFQVVVQYTEEAVGRQALEWATRLVQACLDEQPFDIDPAIAALKQLDEDVRLGPSTGAIVDAAVARGIPFRRLTQGSLVQFGWGSQQRRIQAAEIDATSAIAESIAQDKDLTKELLQSAGVPVPNGRPVFDEEDAWKAAQEIGGPVVVKPRDGNQGKGVTVNIQTREQVIAAFQHARQYRDDILVERYLPGVDYRLLVIGDQLVAAARRDPPLVVGDGTSCVRDLVEQVNADPRRGDGHATPMTRIRLDDIAREHLQGQGLTPDSIPQRGQRVVLRNNANLSTGGSATDVTNEVHTDVAARAVAAAKIVGLDICGVDVICHNVNVPLEDQGGGIVEVNAAPGLRMHLSPSFGMARPVGEAVVSLLYPSGDDGRIPVIAVTGTNGKTTTVRLTAHLLQQRGWRVGMTNTDGVYVNGRQTDSGDCSGPRSARNVLLHPDVDAAVFETARGGLLREGLAYDRCQVAVVTNIGSGDHLGLNFITTVEDLRVLKRVIVLNVAPQGMAVLNAADPEVVKMARHCPGEICYFGPSPDHPVIATHRALGKRVIYREGHQIVATEGEASQRFALSDIPITDSGHIPFQVDNAMAAIGAAWAVNLSWTDIAHGLASFHGDIQGAPGRFNQFQYRGARVIADYGHNPDAIQALCEAIALMPAQRRIVVISGAGDRRDQDIRDQTRILGQWFDQVILYQDACQRGRADGEVLQLLREGLNEAAVTRHVEDIRGELAAIDSALDRLEAGDLCLILIDQVDTALAHIQQRVSASAA